MKKTIISSILFFAVSAFTFTNCQKAAVIDETDVTRIISTLASDEMEGRMIFTPGIEKASQFIQSEFEKIGLEYLDGLTSYNQQFKCAGQCRANNCITRCTWPVTEHNNYRKTNQLSAIGKKRSADTRLYTQPNPGANQDSYNILCVSVQRHTICHLQLWLCWSQLYLSR